MKAIFIAIGLSLLVSCGSAPRPIQSPLASPFVSMLPTSAPTALPPSSTPSKPLPSVTPGPTPVIYQPFAEPVIDCQMFPVLAGCGQFKLTLQGRLAVYNDQTQQLSVLDLSSRSGWQISQAVRIMDWSPSGHYLLVRDPNSEYIVYNDAGTPVGQYSSAGTNNLPAQLIWAAGDTLNFAPFTIISTSGAKAGIEATGKYSEQKRVIIQFASPSSKIVRWPLDTSDKIHELIAWAPNTHVILADYFYSGNAVWVIGGSLYSIDALTGKIVDLHHTMLRDGAYEWHPTEPGVMVFSATGPNIVGQRLTVLNVVTGKSDYLLGDNVGALTPTWSPDGKLIAYSVIIPPSFVSPNPAFSSPAIYIIDPATDKTHAVTNPEKGAVDSVPRWSADGQYLVYVRDYQSQGYVEIRVAAVNGSVDAAVVTQLPPIHCFFNDYLCFSKGLVTYAPAH